jgi:transcription initiation factor IIF auxiliary subunit
MKPNFDDIQGRVRAEFILDKDNNPEFIKGQARRHYKMKLIMETQNPDVQQVIYKLDPTYYDPIRESSDGNNNFEVELTSYGDYPVTVDAYVGSETVRKVVPLSDLLSETHGEAGNANIKEAIEEIKKY